MSRAEGNPGNNNRRPLKPDIHPAKNCLIYFNERSVKMVKNTFYFI